MRDLLELELAERLAPAEAPDTLWPSIERAMRHSACQPSAAATGRLPGVTFPLRWPVAAIATILVAAGALWMVAKGQEPAPNLRRLASIEASSTEALAVRSSDPAEVSRWLEKESGIKAPLAPAADVRLVGARMVRDRGVRVAVVSFQVKEASHTVLLARAAAPAHAGVEWAVAGSASQDLACLLCHSTL